MKEQGVVTRLISSKLAEVALKRSSACEKCGLCHDVGEGMVGLEAANEVGAKRNDVVEIEFSSEEVVKGSIVIFLLPVLFLIGGYLFGSAVSRTLALQNFEEILGVFCALVFLFVSFYVIKWYDKNVEQKQALRAKIIRLCN